GTGGRSAGRTAPAGASSRSAASRPPRPAGDRVLGDGAGPLPHPSLPRGGGDPSERHDADRLGAGGGGPRRGSHQVGTRGGRGGRPVERPHGGDPPVPGLLLRGSAHPAGPRSASGGPKPG